LKLGLHPAHSLSVPELVDSSPNLYVLELKELHEISAFDPQNELSSVYWRATAVDGSYSNPKHHQLRVFWTDLPCTNLMGTGSIFIKFPNLVELRLGTVEGVALEQFLSFVQCTHPKLQRLSWISMQKFTLDELFHHLIRVPGQLPCLTSYSLRSNYKDCIDATWPDSIQDMEELANVLLNLPTKRNNSSSLVINLLLKCLSGKCIPKEKEESASKDCHQCYLHEFIQRHNLPIRLPSVREIDEMERKNEWDHRFASTWIYK
jgi:hypothetical protein